MDSVLTGPSQSLRGESVAVSGDDAANVTLRTQGVCRFEPRPNRLPLCRRPAAIEMEVERGLVGAGGEFNSGLHDGVRFRLSRWRLGWVVVLSYSPRPGQHHAQACAVC